MFVYDDLIVLFQFWCTRVLQVILSSGIDKQKTKQKIIKKYKKINNFLTSHIKVQGFLSRTNSMQVYMHFETTEIESSAHIDRM